MQWLQNNLIWIALAVVLFSLMRFGHGRHSGSCGSHADHRRGAAREPDTGVPQSESSEVGRAASRVTHEHATASVPTIGATGAAQGEATAHAGHEAAPTPPAARRHRHGC